MVSDEYSEAIVELLDILEHSEESIIKKIPKNLLSFWQQEKSKTYKSNLDHSKTLCEMNLKKKTKSLIGMIYLNYLGDSYQKEKIKMSLIENEKRYLKQQSEKYSSDNIFKNKKIDENICINEKKETALIECKDNFFTKLRKILHI